MIFMKINKQIAIIMTILIIASIFIVQNNCLNKYDYDERNILDVYFFNNENISIFVEETISIGLRLIRWNRNIVINLSVAFILMSMLNITDIFKSKNIFNINETFLLYSYSVFVVYFANKKDGKKHKLGLIS